MTVVGLGAVEVAPVVIVAPAAAGTTGQPITVSPVVVLTDPDSDIESVVVTVDGDGVFGWGALLGGIDADDSVAGQVTFSGAASAGVYQQVLQSVTLTSATAGVQTVSFEVTDVDGNSNVLPAATAVTVVGLGAVEVSPVVIVAPAAAGTTGQPITVSPVVVLTDPDSQIESVVVTVDGDGVFGWGALPGGLDADDSVAGQVTFSGAASESVYQQVLQSITLTSATAGLSTVEFTVTDVDGNTNVLPAATAVTVVGLGAVEVAPVVIVAPAAAGTTGQPVTVSPIVVLTDPDSDIESVVVTVDGGGVLGWTLSGGIDADDSVAGQVTFSGAATAAAYQDLLQSLTLTSSVPGLKSVSFAVTDVDGNSNVLPAATVVTVVGLGAVEVSPVVIVAPAAAGTTGQPITVSPIVVLTDPDSDIESVVVTVDGGGVLGWTLSGGIDADDSVAGQVTFSGAATAAVYQQVLQSLTLTSASTGVSTVSFEVTDVDGNSNVLPAATAVTVVGLGPVEVSPILVVAPAAAGLAGQPITVSPIVVLTDPDSQIESVVVTVDGDGVLGWTLSGGIDADDSVAGQVTFSGAATAAAYQDLLQSLTLTSAAPGLQTVSFEVTDVDGNTNVLPAATAVTVVGLGAVEVSPVVIVAPAAAGTTGQPITVSPIVVLTDPDSDIESVVVTVDGDGVFGWGALPDEIDADDSVAGQVTFSGAATAAVYQQVLQSLTLTSASTGVSTVSFTVTDVDGNSNVLSAATAVTVVGLGAVEVAPVVIVAPAAAGTTGQPITVSPVVVLTDPDSDIESVVVTVDGDGVLGWGTLPGGIDADDSVAGQVTFTGAASAAVYQQVLQSITLTSGTAGISTVSFAVTDADGNTNVLSAGTVVTVVGLGPVEVSPVLIVAPAAAGTTGQPITVSPVVVLTDLDSDIESVVVTLDGDGVLGWGALPVGIDADDTVAGQVTFSGAATAAAYKDVLQSVTLTSASAGISTVSFAVTDADGNTNVLPAGTAVTVVGLGPVEVAPVLIVAPAAAGTTGQPITVSPVVVLTDPDSNIETVVVTVTGDGVLGWGTLPGGIDADDTVPGQVTFTGAATAAAYQQVLQSVTLTSSVPGLKSVEFAVTDVDGNTNVLPAGTVVTVVGLGPVEVSPVLIVAPAAAGTTGQPITVSPVVVLTDPDSDIESVVVTVTGDGVLGWGALSGGISADDQTPGQVTFTGAASASVYQQVLQSITLTSGTAGISTVSFAVTDADGNTNALSAATTVTVVGLPASAPIVLTSIVSVPYTAGATAVTVDPAIILLDGDSGIMSGATVTVVDPEAGDTLSWGTLPPDVVANFVGGVLTFEGDASVGEYQDLLRSVRFATNSTASTAVRVIEFTVTDDTLATSTAGSVGVTVLSLPILAAPVVVTSVANVNYTAGSTATTVDSNLVLLDADSSMLSGAVVSIVGGAGVGETLSFQTLGDIDGNYSNGVLTFEGAGTLAEYQQVLRSVTYSTSSGALATIKSISFVVTDADGRVSSPGLVAVTIVSAPLNVAPLVVTSGVNLSYTAGGTPLTIDGNLSLLELDSNTLKGATVKIVGNFAAGDILDFSGQPGISGSYDDATGTLTFTGDAAVSVYQELLRSVTISTGTSALATIKTVSFTVTDLQNATSLPGSVAVTVVAAPVNLSPLVTTLLGPIYTAGNTAVAVNPLLTVLDLDSSTMQGASVAITGNFTPGDILSFTPTSGIMGNFNTATGVLTFVGSASTATYQQLLRSVTFASGALGTTSVKTITFTVTDSLGSTSPGALALVTQTANSAPVVTATFGLILLSLPVVASTASIVDDSSFLDRSVITVTNPQSGDTLSFTPTASTGSIVGDVTGNGSVLTLTGSGTVAEYEAALRAVRFNRANWGLFGLRNISITVRDAQGLTSTPTTGTINWVL
ncbi:beta strand repeat-containing protein [Mycolicibacterium iranicum]|uniref:Uncharacterized protein n=1 Tax=Mycolicibacterium iranicum TaxID=912594 RepID=A0A1X1WU11_MYCIR|nr:hypothetical protein [Mycolicibacterium iranicum]ORV90023.1 hypothetical protein AWC12_00215 [Mycolicibacterium iranicum]